MTTTALCRFADCNNKADYKDYLCRSHHDQQLRGELLRPIRESLEARFWSKVAKSSSCWNWTSVTSKGYGRIRYGVDRQCKWGPAHRVSWEIHYGNIPEGLWVLHHCDNPKCVRPKHLFLGSALDNSRDMMAKGRQRFLPKGFKFPKGVITGRPRGVKSTRTLGVSLGRPKGTKLSKESLESFRRKRGFRLHK